MQNKIKDKEEEPPSLPPGPASSQRGSSLRRLLPILGVAAGSSICVNDQSTRLEMFDMSYKKNGLRFIRWTWNFLTYIS